MGIVADNKDPDCLGRLRIAMDMLSPGCVGPWYPMMKQPQTCGLLPEFCRQNSPANQARLQTGTGCKHGKQTFPAIKSEACNYKKSSGSLTVKLLLPEITKAEWQNADGNSASKGLVGDTLKLHAETNDMSDGAGVRFCVYDSKTGGKVADPAAEWTCHYD